MLARYHALLLKVLVQSESHRLLSESVEDSPSSSIGARPAANFSSQRAELSNLSIVVRFRTRVVAQQGSNVLHSRPQNLGPVDIVDFTHSLGYFRAWFNTVCCILSCPLPDKLARKRVRSPGSGFTRYPASTPYYTNPLLELCVTRVKMWRSPSIGLGRRSEYQIRVVSLFGQEFLARHDIISRRRNTLPFPAISTDHNFEGIRVRAQRSFMAIGAPSVPAEQS